MVSSLKVARRRGGSARVTLTLAGRLNLPYVLGSKPGTLRGSGAQTEVSLAPGTGPRPAAKNDYDHRPASAHIFTRRAAKRSPQRRRVSLPRLPPQPRLRPFHLFGVGRHRTMKVWLGKRRSRRCPARPRAPASRHRPRTVRSLHDGGHRNTPAGGLLLAPRLRAQVARSETRLLSRCSRASSPRAVRAGSAPPRSAGSRRRTGIR